MKPLMYGYTRVSKDIEGSVIQRWLAASPASRPGRAAPLGKAALMNGHRTWLRKILFVDHQASTPPRRVMVMTDSRIGTGHRVTDEAFAAGRRAGGRYVAVCGLPVLPASLTAPERDYCPKCEQDSALGREGGGLRGSR
jgi:hypothetical protein